MSASQDIVPRSLDLTTRSVDLIATLIESSTSPNGLLNLGIEIGQWLSRERLSRNELEDCLVRARSIAQPNAIGQQFLQCIMENETTQPVLPLFLRQSGSIGMWLTRDPNLSWLVSTTTCLFQFFNEDEVVKRISDILHGQERPDTTDKSHRRRFFSKIQTQSVVKKIVSSIWYNVVNSNNQDLRLPTSLQDVCLKGHFTDFFVLKQLIKALSKSTGELMVQSNQFLTDVTLWLIHHFDGDLTITVSGRKLFSRTLGDSHRKLEIRVKRFCPKDGSCASEGARDPEHTYELFDIVGNQFTKLYQGYATTGEKVLEPQARQALYEIQSPPCMVEPKLVNNKSLIRCTAQHMMRWLLELHLLPPPPNFKIAFSVVLGAQLPLQQRLPLRTIDLMKQSPSILNKAWGNEPLQTPVYAAPAEDDLDINDHAHPSRGHTPFYGRRTEHHDFRRLALYFPILQNLLGKVRPACHCIDCIVDEFTCKGWEPKAGCLLNTALVQIGVLIAHGIADCFGIEDRSAKIHPENLAQNVSRLLLDVVEGGYLLWDIWFGVAASVLLGSEIPWLEATEDVTCISSEGSNIAAIQYGNLAAIAEWIDPSRELKLRGCFGLIVGQGRLAASATTNQQRRFQTVNGNFALIRSGNTEDTFSYVDARGNAQNPWSILDGISEDDSTLECDFILAASHKDETYTLLTRVQSPNHSRIVCLADALGSMAQNILVPFEILAKQQICIHTQLNTEARLNDGSGFLYSFDDLLGKWSFYEEGREMDAERPLHTHHTFFLKEHKKINVALALAYNSPVAVCGQNRCQRCAVDELRALEWHPDGEAYVKDQFVLNVSDGIVDSRHGKRRLKDS